MRLVLLALLLVACAAPVTAGSVTDRVFEPQHEETYTASELGCGWGVDYEGDYTYGCGRLVSVQKQRTVPDRWFLMLENCGASSDDCQRGRVEVAEAVYVATAIGDYYEVPE